MKGFVERIAVLRHKLQFRINYHNDEAFQELGGYGKINFTLEKGTELRVWVSKNDSDLILFFLRHLDDGRKMDWYLKPSDVRFLN